MNVPVLKPIERLWRVRDVCAFLGMGKTFVYQRAAAGDLPSLKLGSSLRFDPDEVRAWKERQGRVSAPVVSLAPRKDG